MSLLRWKELAKSKSELGNKINYVHNAIKQHKIGEQTNQESFAKVFKPVTSKLDDVIDSNLNLGMPQMRKRPPRKGEVPNYGIDIDDEVEDMGLDDLFGDYVPPQQEKQIVPKPPTYEDSLADVLSQYPQELPPEQYAQELPPEYDDDEEVDYTIDDEDLIKGTLEDIGISDYEQIETILDQPEMTDKKKRLFINKIIKNAKFKRKQLSGLKANVTKQYKKGEISEAERQIKNKRIDNARVVLNEYIKHYDTKLKTMKGSGIKGRRKQRGGNVVFFNDVKQLLKKLELIIGEVIAGNTSIQMRNTGVSILDMLLKMAKINRSQYNKLYNQYFKA